MGIHLNPRKQHFTASGYKFLLQVKVLFQNDNQHLLYVKSCSQHLMEEQTESWGGEVLAQGQQM